MQITYVLDTSVLIYDPFAYKHFANSLIVIPITVLNELDNLKKQSGEAGKNARVAIKVIDEISNKGDISNGVYLDNGTSLLVDSTFYDLKNPLFSGFGNPDYGDTQILACAFSWNMKAVSNEVVFLSNDINLRIKAKSRGINAKSHDDARFSFSELFSGIKTIVNEEAGSKLQENNHIDPAVYGIDLEPNECVYFQNVAGDGIALGRKVAPNKVKLLRKQFPWGLSSKNKEQAFAIDLLMDKNIDLVTLIGKAGTGKSIVALASALELVINKKEYNKLIVYRPIQAVGNDIGFLPGLLEEKLSPWFQAIMDNFEPLFSTKGGGDWRRNFEMYQRKGVIELGAITYIRGRSMPNSIIMIDECFPYNQNIETEFGKKRIGILCDMFIKGKELPLVKSFNEKEQKFEYKKIVNAWNRGEKNLVKLTCGNVEIKCTENHRFLTQNGWKQISEMRIGEFIKTTPANKHQILRSLNEDQEQVVLGSFLGDGSVSNHGNGRYRLKVIHGIKQEEYCKWKAGLFSAPTKIIEKNGFAQTKAINFATKMFGLQNELPKTKTTCPQWVLDKLDARGIAIWFMDDGSVTHDFFGARISTCSFDEDSQIRIVEKFKSLGIECYYKFYKAKNHKQSGYFYIIFNKEGYRKLAELIAPYINNNINYKVFNCENVEKYNWNSNYLENGLTVVDKIEFLNETKTVYDLEVEDNHNFIACSQGPSLGGLIAHNCQNLSKEEIKTILTRAGEGTKVVLTGDIEQIDNKSLDAVNNGLTYTIEKFKESNIAGHITFTQGERSRLASTAAELL